MIRDKLIYKVKRNSIKMNILAQDLPYERKRKTENDDFFRNFHRLIFHSKYLFYLMVSKCEKNEEYEMRNCIVKM